MSITFTASGITVGETAYTLDEIKAGVEAKRREALAGLASDLTLVSFSYNSYCIGTELFDKFIVSNSDAELLKGHIVNTILYLGEVEGEHSEPFCEPNESNFISDQNKVIDFLIEHPKGRVTNFDFLQRLVEDYEYDGYPNPSPHAQWFKALQQNVLTGAYVPVVS